MFATARWRGSKVPWLRAVGAKSMGGRFDNWLGDKLVAVRCANSSRTWPYEKREGWYRGARGEGKRVKGAILTKWEYDDHVCTCSIMWSAQALPKIYLLLPISQPSYCLLSSNRQSHLAWEPGKVGIIVPNYFHYLDQIMRCHMHRFALSLYTTTSKLEPTIVLVMVIFVLARTTSAPYASTYGYRKGSASAYYCPSLLTGSWHDSCRVSNNKLPTGRLQAVTAPHANNAGTTG